MSVTTARWIALVLGLSACVEAEPVLEESTAALTPCVAQALQWRAPVVLAGDAPGDGPPAIAIGADGSAVVAWREVNGSSYRIRANRYTRVGLTWRWLPEPETIATYTDASSPAFPRKTPAAAADGNGNAYVVWSENITNSSGYRIRASRFGGATWSTPVTLATPAGDLAYLGAGEVGVAADATGLVMAVWDDLSFAQRDVRAARFENGAWQPSVRVNVGSGAFGPRIVAGPTGGVDVVWTTADAVVARRFRAGSWQAPVTLNSPNGTSVVLGDLAASTSGNAVAAWTARGASESVFLSVANATGAWSAPAQVVGPSTERFGYTVAIDPTDHGTVLYSQKQGYYLRARGIAPNGTLDPVAVAFPDQSGGVRVRADDAGRTIALFLHGSPYQLHASTLIPPSGPGCPGGWTSATPLDPTPGQVLGGDLAVHPSGLAIAAWREFILGSYVINATVYR
jgi:hypothetical protein